MEEILELSTKGQPLRGAQELGIDSKRIERILDPGSSALESTGGSHGPSADLEAVVRLHARPSLIVRQGEVTVGDSKVWQKRFRHHDRLSAAIAAVGRVNVVNHASFDWIGTAWQIAEKTIITNRHVALDFAEDDDADWPFAKGANGRTMAANVDYLAEHDRTEARKFRVSRVRWVWHGPGPTSDLALLDVEGDDLPPPITLSEDECRVDQFVAAIGYPARDSRNEDAAMARIFDNIYGVKRCAPGQITELSSRRMEHDCSTLGGNSGSAIIDLETGKAVGLHFGGSFKKTNYAVPAAAIQTALQRSDTKVSVAAKPGGASAIGKPTAASPAAASAPTANAATPSAQAVTAAAPTVAPAVPPQAGAIERILQQIATARHEVESAFAALRTQVDSAKDALPAKAACTLLETLRNERRDDVLVTLGRLIVARGQNHPAVHRLLAQGQIETGALDDAIDNLAQTASDLDRRLAAATDPTAAAEALWIRREQAEVQGLLGRAYKQRYVEANPTRQQPRSADAEKALKCYGDTYRASPVENLWHGINFVALRHHQHRLTRMSENDRDAEADRIATDILRNIDVLEKMGQATEWDVATRAEAELALGRDSDFAATVEKLLTHDGMTAFVARSFRRQLVQVWELEDATSPGQTVLPRIDAWLTAARKAKSAALDASASTADAARMQAPAKADVQTTTEDNRGVRRARSLARIGPSFYTGEGSGFLLDPAAIWPDYSGEPNLFLLTNAHVCDPAAKEDGTKAPFHPRTARFAFLGPTGEIGREVLVASAEALWSSPPNELDATLLMLEKGPKTELFPPRESMPVTGDSTAVVGYPLGGSLYFSANQNVIGSVEERYLTYTTKTEPGMSGSPVVDGDWQLVGLHRHYAREKQQNGGVRIDRILAAIRTALEPKFGKQGPKPFADPAKD